MGTVTSKESQLSRQIDQQLKAAADRRPRLLCLGEPLPPVSSTLQCDFIQLPQQPPYSSPDNIVNNNNKSRKWLQLLAAASQSDTTQGIVFTVPLTWYEQSTEDVSNNKTTNSSNKLQQALNYFSIIRKHFYNLSIVVILTNRPEFTARIRSGEEDMVDHFPRFPGAPEDPTAALHFIRNEFKRLFYESRISDDWANLFILYDDGCKRQRSTFLAQAIHAIGKTHSFAHIDDMLTPCHGLSLATTTSTTKKVSLKSCKHREQVRTNPISSDESCSESTNRV